MLEAVSKSGNEWNIRTMRDFIESTERRLASMKRELERAEKGERMLHVEDIDTIGRQALNAMRDWHQLPSGSFGFDVWRKLQK